MYNDKFFLVVIACGHVGKRKSIEISRYFKAGDVLSCYDSANNMPRSKKKNNSIKMIREVTEAEYLKGKLTEQDNLYLSTFNKCSVKKINVFN